MSFEQQMKELDKKMTMAQNVLQAAIDSGNVKFAEKAKEALEQIVKEKKDLLESFSLTTQEKTPPEGFKLNIVQGNMKSESIVEKKENEDLPPHLKR